MNELIEVTINLITRILIIIVKGFYYIPLGISAFFNKDFITKVHFKLLVLSVIITSISILWLYNYPELRTAACFLIMPYIYVVGKEYKKYKGKQLEEIQNYDLVESNNSKDIKETDIACVERETDNDGKVIERIYFK